MCEHCKVDVQVDQWEVHAATDRHQENRDEAMAASTTPMLHATDEEDTTSPTAPTHDIGGSPQEADTENITEIDTDVPTTPPKGYVTPLRNSLFDEGGDTHFPESEAEEEEEAQTILPFGDKKGENTVPNASETINEADPPEREFEDGLRLKHKNATAFRSKTLSGWVSRNHYIGGDNPDYRMLDQSEICPECIKLRSTINERARKEDVLPSGLKEACYKHRCRP